MDKDGGSLKEGAVFLKNAMGAPRREPEEGVKNNKKTGNKSNNVYKSTSIFENALPYPDKVWYDTNAQTAGEKIPRILADTHYFAEK